MFWEHGVEPRHQFGELTHLSSTNSVLSENLAEWLGDQAEAQVMQEVELLRYDLTREAWAAIIDRFKNSLAGKRCEVRDSRVQVEVEEEEDGIVE